MNYIVTAKPVHFPISPDRPATLPVSPVAGSNTGSGNARHQPSGYIYRGDLLETGGDKTYRPSYNQEIDPHNRRAIDSYRKIADAAPTVGRILDGYI